MSEASAPIAFVLGSNARREVVLRLIEGAGTGREIVASTSASESAAYDALNRLADSGLVVEGDEGWQLTGSGRLVADALWQCERLEAVIETDPDYWRRHDLSTLPKRYRAKMHRLADAEVLRAPETDPYRTVRRIERAIRAAEEVSIVAPIYNDRHAAALLEADASPRRLILTPDVVERLLRDEPDGPDEEGIEHVDIRVQPAGLAMSLTDTELLLSLPRRDGSYDTSTEVIAESEAAVEWGSEVFEHYWADATPVAEWITAELPELADRAAIDRGGH